MDAVLWQLPHRIIFGGFCNFLLFVVAQVLVSGQNPPKKSSVVTVISHSSNRPNGPIGSNSRDVRVLFVCLSPFHVLNFEAYFAPTSRSRMSKKFRDSESLGKRAGKKWSQNWTFLLGSGLKLPCKKKLVFCWFSLTKHGGNHASRWIRDLWSKGISLILAYL